MRQLHQSLFDMSCQEFLSMVVVTPFSCLLPASFQDCTKTEHRPGMDTPLHSIKRRNLAWEEPIGLPAETHEKC